MKIETDIYHDNRLSLQLFYKYDEVTYNPVVACWGAWTPLCSNANVSASSISPTDSSDQNIGKITSLLPNSSRKLQFTN